MAITVQIGNQSFPSKAAAIARCQEILYSYPGEPGSGAGQPQAVTDPGHITFLAELIKRHPEADEKIGPGLQGFKVQVNPQGTGNTRCFYAIRVDGSQVDFSFRSCLK